MLCIPHTRAAPAGAAYEYILSLLLSLCDQYGEGSVFTGNYSLQLEAQAIGARSRTSLSSASLPLTGDLRTDRLQCCVLWVAHSALRGTGPPTTPLPGSLAHPQTWEGETAPKIANLSDATRALLAVSEQGGGCPVPGKEELWPKVANISAGPLGSRLSHFARFAQIDAGRAYRGNDTVEGGPTGEPIVTNWSAVQRFEPNPSVSNFAVGSAAYNLSLAFATKYTSLLVQLHNTFNGAPETYSATLGSMHDLAGMAATLMAMPDPRYPERSGLGVGPPWEYVPAASQFAVRQGRARPISQHNQGSK